MAPAPKQARQERPKREKKERKERPKRGEQGKEQKGKQGQKDKTYVFGGLLEDTNVDRVSRCASVSLYVSWCIYIYECVYECA